MVEAVRRALTEVGEVSNAYGVTIRANFIPVIKAAVRDKENPEARWRRAPEAAGPSPTAEQGRRPDDVLHTPPSG
jgi:hypothetical protein